MSMVMGVTAMAVIMVIRMIIAIHVANLASCFNLHSKKFDYLGFAQCLLKTVFLTCIN